MDQKTFNHYLQEEDDKGYFTQNSLAYYYEDMANKEKLIKELAKRIVEYDVKQNVQLSDIETQVAAELSKWDSKVEELPETVNGLLSAWVEDGTLTHVIDSTIVDQKVAPFNAKLKEVESLTGGDLKSKWVAPTQPARNEIISSTSSVSSFMDLWEGLRLADPVYITRTHEGKDQSGLYDLWAYDFKPENFEKTIILSATVHGSEHYAQTLIYRLMHHVVNDFNTSTHLHEMRHKVRFIIIPIANPWGLANSKRENVNNVDINRNYNYRHALETDPKKGTAPLSESETRVLSSIIDRHPEALVYIDFHNTESGLPYDYFSNMPALNDMPRDVIHRTIDLVKPKPDVVPNIQYHEGSRGYNYASSKGIPAATIEWVPGKLSGTSYDSLDVTYGVEYFGNLISQFIARSEKKTIGEPFAMTVSHKTTFQTSATDWTEIPELTFEFEPDINGILQFSGTLVVHGNTTVPGNVYIAPVVLQTGNSQITTGTLLTQQDENTVYCYSTHVNDRIPINFTLSKGIVPKGYAGGKVQMKIYWKTTSNLAYMRSSLLNATFIPTNKAKNSVWLKRTSSTDATLKQTYPIE